MDWCHLIGGPVEQDAAVLIHAGSVIGIQQHHKWRFQSFSTVDGHHAHAFVAIRLRKTTPIIQLNGFCGLAFQIHLPFIGGFIIVALAHRFYLSNEATQTRIASAIVIEGKF